MCSHHPRYYTRRAYASERLNIVDEALMDYQVALRFPIDDMRRSQWSYDGREKIYLRIARILESSNRLQEAVQILSNGIQELPRSDILTM